MTPRWSDAHAPVSPNLNHMDETQHQMGGMQARMPVLLLIARVARRTGAITRWTVRNKLFEAHPQEHPMHLHGTAWSAGCRCTSFKDLCP